MSEMESNYESKQDQEAKAKKESALQAARDEAIRNIPRGEIKEIDPKQGKIEEETKEPPADAGTAITPGQRRLSQMGISSMKGDAAPSGSDSVAQSNDVVNPVDESTSADQQPPQTAS